jgi:Tripartite tricarboxylate transporter TctB family
MGEEHRHGVTRRAMILRRDYIVGVFLLVAAAAIFTMSGDLPVGTLGSPGPGMVPMLALAFIAIFSIALMAGGASSPPWAEIEWSGLSHAAAVTVAATIAAVAYERLGFVVTMALLLVGVLVIIERIAVWRAILFAFVAVFSVYFLLAKLLKSPLPIGPFGI